MDQNPWTFEIMGKELDREGRYEEFSDPKSVEISDIRNYIYIDYGEAIVDQHITS